jgi:hypothetical protein
MFLKLRPSNGGVFHAIAADRKSVPAILRPRRIATLHVSSTTQVFGAKP